MSYIVQVNGDWSGTTAYLEFKFSVSYLMPNADTLVHAAYGDNEGQAFSKAVFQAIEDHIFDLHLDELHKPVKFAGYFEPPINPDELQLAKLNNFWIRGSSVIDISCLTDRMLLDTIDGKVKDHLISVLRQFTIMYYMVMTYREAEVRKIQEKIEGKKVK